MYIPQTTFSGPSPFAFMHELSKNRLPLTKPKVVKPKQDKTKVVLTTPWTQEEINTLISLAHEGAIDYHLLKEKVNKSARLLRKMCRKQQIQLLNCNLRMHPVIAEQLKQELASLTGDLSEEQIAYLTDKYKLTRFTLCHHIKRIRHISRVGPKVPSKTAPKPAS